MFGGDGGGARGRGFNDNDWCCARASGDVAAVGVVEMRLLFVHGSAAGVAAAV